MADRAKHAFGSSSGIESALASGKIDAFDILFLDGNTDNPKVGWIDKDGNPVIIKAENEVASVDALPESGETGVIYICNKTLYIWDGAQFVVVSESTDLSVLLERMAAVEEQTSTLSNLMAAIEAEVAKKADAEEVKLKLEEIDTKLSEAETRFEEIADELGNASDKFAEIEAKYLLKKYEITNVPEGTLVDYRDKEIRVMCPADAEWVKQQVGATGNANMYYMGFKAYAPEGAVSFKEGDRGVIVDEMFTFDDDFAGTDEFGRNYSICWLALASYDTASDTWSYFGKNSSAEKYIGWTYVVEWYDANGVIIASDMVRINLSNEECHYVIEPYYMAQVTANVKKYVDEQIEEIVDIQVVEF